MKLHYLKIWTYLQPLFRKFCWKRWNCKFHSHFTARSSVEHALAWLLWSLTKTVQKSSKWNLARWNSWGWSLYSLKSTLYAALDCWEWIFVSSNTRIKSSTFRRRCIWLKWNCCCFHIRSPFLITYSFKNILNSNFHKTNEEIMYRYLVAIRFLQQPPKFICRHFY